MILLHNLYYLLDLEKISKFLDHSGTNSNKETEITDAYELSGDAESPLLHTGKTVREIKTPASRDIDSLKYDLLKTLIVQLLTYNGNIMAPDANNLGLMLAFNTLLNEGFLVEVKQENTANK